MEKILFRLINGIPCFQRIINEIIKTTICRLCMLISTTLQLKEKPTKNKIANSAKFLKLVKDCNLILKEDKCVYSAECIILLSYQINRGFLKPDPE